MSAGNAIPLVEPDCPVCGGRARKILRAGSYPRDISLDELQRVYCASSDHTLMDQVVECACGMVYLSPRLDDRLIRSGYASAEDSVFVAQNPQRIRTFEKKVRAILRRTRLDPMGKRLLDIGCAGGAFLVASREAGFEVQGIEPSRWMGEYARAQYRLDVRQGFLEPGMFLDASFDVITLWDVIEHVPSPRDVLAVVHGLLKPGGYLWVSYPDIGSVAAKLLGWRWPFWLSVHLHYFRRHSMRSQLERSGFAVAYMEPYGQQLPFGYVLQRAAAVVPAVKPLQRMASFLHLGALPFRYNMGQTLVVARREGR